MKSNSLKLILSAGLFLLPAMSLQAGLDTVLKVELNCYFQAKTSLSGNIDAGKVGNVRLNSKQLLTLIGRERGIRFPYGSQLKVTDVGYVYVADSNGNSILDASPYVQVTFFKGKELLNGKINIANGKEDTRTYYQLALRLNLTTLKGTLRGIGIEDLIVTAPDRDGIQIARGNTDSTVNGKGIVNGGTGYFDGRINLKGRSAVIR